MKSFLSKLWSIWKGVGRTIGDFIGRVILMVFYFTIVLPFGLGVRLVSDPLKLHTTNASSFWLPRETKDKSLDDARRQS